MDEVPSPLPDVTPETIAAADCLAGRANADAHRQQMAANLMNLRDRLMTLRTSPLARDHPPAFVFNPLVPGLQPRQGTGKVQMSRAPLLGYNGDPETLAFATVTELARLLKARKVTSVELTRMYLERLKRYGPGLCCVVSLCEERALAEARMADAMLSAGWRRSPLLGIPYVAKDLFAAEGTRTTFGASPYAEQVWDYDAAAVANLKERGAVLLGKVSMGELAMGDVWFGGTTRNPWKPTTGSSGSSAGSASAVAAGLCAFALGTETYGSIISPSMRCGTVGLRPTFGSVSRYGAMPLSWTMDKIGPLCRSSEDAALIFDAIRGADERDPSSLVSENTPFHWNPARPLNFYTHRPEGLVVGVDELSFAEAGEPQKAVLDVLKELGVTLKPITWPERKPEYEALPGIIIGVEGAAAFAELAACGGFDKLVQQEDGSWPNVLRCGATIPASDYVQAMRVRRQLQQEMANVIQDVDCYVTVTYKSPSLPFTNLTGHPTVITRCGLTDDGLPAMIEFTGKLFREETILHLAHAYEKATGFVRQWPDSATLPEGTPPALETPEPKK